jgi:ribonuclease HII
MAESMAVAVGIVNSDVIDSIGIAAATRRAMLEALQSLAVQPGYVLIDWLTLPRLRLRQEGIRKGDALCLSIACASVIAKVTRDRLMDKLDGHYPGYGFGTHKGYGTEEHLHQLQAQGASPVHRVTFRPVRLVVGGLL